MYLIPRPGRSNGIAAASVANDRRRQARYLLTRPIVAIAVMLSDEPDAARTVEGFSVDVGRGGIGLEVMGLDDLPTKRVVVGIEGDDGARYFAVVEARSIEHTPCGLRIGGEFAPRERDILSPDYLLPTIDHTTYRFSTRLRPSALDQWVARGVLRPYFLDRVLVCPECSGLPTFRNGCRMCGSANLASERLMHHFACAHVGFVRDFESDGELICPKCRARSLVVGADFEYLFGPYCCGDCNWSDTDTELAAQCLACQFRFPCFQAAEQPLMGYDVNRLDPLALLAESR